MLEFAWEDEQIRRWAFHAHETAMRHVQVDFSSDCFWRGKDWIKAALTKDVADQIRHRVFFTRSGGRCSWFWICFFCTLKKFFSPEMKQDVHRGQGNDQLIYGECAWIGKYSNTLRISAIDKLLTLGRPNGSLSKVAWGNATCLLTRSLTLGTRMTRVPGE